MFDLYVLIPVVIILVALALITVWSITLRRVVPTNMVHILQTRGSTVAYGKGKEAGNVYYAWPVWLPVLGVSVSEFPESIFQINLNDYEAYDSARVPFVVDVAAFFRINDAATAAQRVSTFGELRDQLVSVLQGAVRRILSNNTLEDILQERGKFSDEFTSEVTTQIAEWGVSPVKAIEFMDIRDSSKGQVIANIMAKEQSRIESESRQVVAENNQQAQNKEIDAQRTIDLNQQEARQQVGIRKAEADQKIGIANEQSQQHIKEQARVTAERDMAVKQVTEVQTAEITKQVTVVQAEQDRQVKVIATEAERDAAVIKAEGDKKSAITTAEGVKESSVLEAAGIEAIGKAKAAAEQAMLMAPVETQITLAKEIGTNENYQAYLVQIEQIQASVVVGKEMAAALSHADLKIIANSGDVQSGINSFGEVFSGKGGLNMGAMLETLTSTDAGKALAARFLGGETK